MTTRPPPGPAANGRDADAGGPADAGPLLQASGLHWSRREGLWGPRREVLRGVDLAVAAGEVLALLGPNGAGKSTLLRLLLGLLPLQAGTLRLDGRPLAQWPRREIARRMAYVPQQHEAPFPYTVHDMAALGVLPHAGTPGAAGARARIGPVLAELGLADLAQRPYTRLSGGQRQRVLIARALVQGARLLLCDEPDSGLDPGQQQRLLQILHGLAAQGHAIVLCTHRPDHARAIAGRTLLLRDGHVAAVGETSQVLTGDWAQVYA
ncbi:MAG: ABC transporter ATP-binding protein [Pseudacidovorax sp.]|nr:ABC transporter ATP-binding protein [Pseudacidovorax sp.]